MVMVTKIQVPGDKGEKMIQGMEVMMTRIPMTKMMIKTITKMILKMKMMIRKKKNKLMGRNLLAKALSPQN